MLEILAELEVGRVQALLASPGRPGLRTRAGLQQGLVEQGLDRCAAQAFDAFEVRAEHRADAFAHQHMHLHVRRPWWFGEHQQGVQPWPAWIEVAFTCRQVQAQLGQLGIEPPQARNEPARQQAARAAQHERRIAGPSHQGRTGVAQAVERFVTGLVKLAAGSREFEAAPILGEEGHAKMFLKYLELTAYRPMGDMQRLRGAAHATEPGGCLERLQGIQRWKFARHIV